MRTDTSFATDRIASFPLEELPLKLKADASDAVLRLALDRHPRLIGEVQVEATAAFTAVCRTGFADILKLHAFWDRARCDTAEAMPVRGRDEVDWRRAERNAGPALLRIALKSRDAMRGVLADLERLTFAERLALEAKNVVPGVAIAQRRLVMLAHPALAEWLERLEAEADQRAVAERERSARLKTDQLAAAAGQRATDARALLGRLAGGGVQLAAAADGVMAHPGCLLTAADRRDITGLRAELLEILAEPAELVA